MRLIYETAHVVATDVGVASCANAYCSNSQFLSVGGEQW
jgi:hypothetical protein